MATLAAIKKSLRNRRYYARKRQRILARKRRYYQQNRATVTARTRAYKSRNVTTELGASP